MSLTLEFIFAFLLSIFLVIVLSNAINLQIMEAKNQKVNEIIEAQTISLTINTALNDDLETGFLTYFSIEQARLHISKIEVGGVFEKDYSKPI